MIYSINVIWPGEHLPQSQKNENAKGAGFQRRLFTALIAKDSQIVHLERSLRRLKPPTSNAENRM